MWAWSPLLLDYGSSHLLLPFLSCTLKFISYSATRAVFLEPSPTLPASVASLFSQGKVQVDLSSTYPSCKRPIELGPFCPGLPSLTPSHPPGYLSPGLLLISQSTSSRQSLLPCRLLLAPGMIGWGSEAGDVSCVSSHRNWHIVGVLLMLVIMACVENLLFAPLPLALKVLPGVRTLPVSMGLLLRQGWAEGLFLPRSKATGRNRRVICDEGTASGPMGWQPEAKKERRTKGPTSSRSWAEGQAGSEQTRQTLG